MSKRTVERSWALHDRAIHSIPMATQTHAKAPREALRGIEPCYAVRGKGCRIWDLDGNEYIDFRYGMGPVTLGYCYPAVDEAIRRQLENGIVFAYAHPLEVEVAERLIDIIPCAEQVRFLKTGGEAMSAAHRLSRAFTGRDRIITSGYHGWLNTMNRPGVPDATRNTYHALPWGDIAPYIDAFDTHGDQIAAVSIACDYADMEKGHTFLPKLRALTARHNVLLIFDEIVTGFRLRRAGAQEFFGVTPDLSVFAKGISNGMPLACYLGRADIMAGVQDAAISSTFGGDTLALAAANAVLSVYEDEPVIDTLWARGKQLHHGFNDHCRNLDIRARFFGMPPTGQPIFEYPASSTLITRFHGELLKRGVAPYSVFYTNYSHTEADIAVVIKAMGEALKKMRDEDLFH